MLHVHTSFTFQSYLVSFRFASKCHSAAVEWQLYRYGKINIAMSKLINAVLSVRVWDTCCTLVAFGCTAMPRTKCTARRLLVLVNRRLLCNCDSRTVIIITFGLSSAAMSTREYARRRGRGRHRRRRSRRHCRAFERRLAKIIRRLFYMSVRNSSNEKENSSGCIVS